MNGQGKDREDLLRDLQELRKANDDLKASQEQNIKFRKLSANAPGLIYQFTRRAYSAYFVPVASEGIKIFMAVHQRM